MKTSQTSSMPRPEMHFNCAGQPPRAPVSPSTWPCANTHPGPRPGLRHTRYGPSPVLWWCPFADRRSRIGLGDLTHHIAFLWQPAETVIAIVPPLLVPASDPARWGWSHCGPPHCLALVTLFPPGVSILHPRRDILFAKTWNSQEEKYHTKGNARS